MTFEKDESSAMPPLVATLKTIHRSAPEPLPMTPVRAVA
jgi:hypothetical protein